ncbi:cellulose binding domain-containing protein [Natronosporangium hydrolyticum]|uniref:Cellulose binding domain-containing protein n=1 Tax=Natronosporangium hydrolyticum TaxID=2811111 RepID=A0A895YHJ8_9ACTN|nr:cellulose binding domain-containing protein [Natronosporangium hydrolyticum]QSB13198.1 cellulose binding domain-containing protein [Natronosporangium hydrolyticum]
MITLPIGGRPAQRRRSLALAATVALVGAAVGLAPAGPATASTGPPGTGCVLVEYESVSWQDAPDAGGVYTTITITNTCGDPIDGWTLGLTLAPGHTLQQGWNAHWESVGEELTATDLQWNRVLQPDTGITIGFVGTWLHAPQDPVACLINGEPCGGGEAAAEVTLTSPTDGQSIPGPCPVTFTAEPVAGSGELDQVDFYLNQEWVGSVETAPYRMLVPSSHPAVDHVGPNTAAAKAVGPGGGTASAPATFQLAAIPPALMVVACTPNYSLAPGEQAVVSFQAACAGTPAMTFEAGGEAKVTVSPPTAPAGDSYHEVTVTVAADSPPGSASVTAIPDEFGCMSGSTMVHVS